MTREVPGALNPSWAHSPSTPRRERPHRPVKLHLRVSEGSLAGPACGNDLRVARRGGDGTGLPLTDDPDRVSCLVCRRSYAFQLRQGSEERREAS